MHDQLWKRILWAFFADFIGLFFPDIANKLDFTNIKLLDKELFKDSPTGAKREPDLLVEVSAVDGGTELLLIHIEVQTIRDRYVPYRMWEYYSLIRLRKGLPVIPIVLYLRPGSISRSYSEPRATANGTFDGLITEIYTEAPLGQETLTFKYSAISLPDLKEEEWCDRDNPLTPAVIALMRSEETNKVLRRLRAYEIVARKQLDDSRTSLLMYAIEKYLKLNKSEQEELERKMKGSETKGVTEMLTEWERRGFSKGKNAGLLNGKRETLIRLMTRKFGEIPGDVITRIENMNEPDALDEIAYRVMEASSLQEMNLGEA